MCGGGGGGTLKAPPAQLQQGRPGTEATGATHITLPSVVCDVVPGEGVVEVAACGVPV